MKVFYGIIGMLFLGGVLMFILQEMLSEKDTSEKTSNIDIQEVMDRIASGDKNITYAEAKAVNTWKAKQDIKQVFINNPPQFVVEMVEDDNSISPAPKKRVVKRNEKPAATVKEQWKINNLAIDFNYTSASKKETTRQMSVVAISVRGSHTYVRGVCHLRKKFRTFRLDRMHDIINIDTGEVFETTNDFFSDATTEYIKAAA